jgi:hypothetical protein
MNQRSFERVPRTGTEERMTGNQRQGGECVLSVTNWGVSQEEVQKKPELGTTQ